MDLHYPESRGGVCEETNNEWRWRPRGHREGAGVKTKNGLCYSLPSCWAMRPSTNRNQAGKKSALCLTAAPPKTHTQKTESPPAPPSQTQEWCKKSRGDTNTTNSVVCAFIAALLLHLHPRRRHTHCNTGWYHPASHFLGCRCSDLNSRGDLGQTDTDK